MRKISQLSILFLSLLLFTNCSKDKTSEAIITEANLKTNSKNFPTEISLPDGYNPEGIVSGKANALYVGSLYDGRILEIDARTGSTSILIEGESDRTAVGLDYDDRTGYLYVAGGPDGYAYIYDTATGEEIAAIQLSTSTFPETFINDVIVTKDAAYFTNSFMSEYYSVPLNNDGSLAAEGTQTIELTGDFTATEGFNSNGIVASPDGSQLIIVHSALGVLYNVEAETGIATEIDLEASLVNGDGLVLQGKTLFVVQNSNNQISEVRLDSQWTSAELVEVITDSDFRVPTTATISGGQLYVVNARFDVAPPPFLGMGYDPTIEFEVVAVDEV